MLYAFSRDRIDNISFELLRAKVDERFGEGGCKATSKHDNELFRVSPRVFYVSFDTGERRLLTATSGLSAKTYSCGGDGSRLGRGGDSAFGLEVAAGAALEKNLRIPSFFVNCRSVSTSDGTSDNSEDSSELMLVVVEFVVVV